MRGSLPKLKAQGEIHIDSFLLTSDEVGSREIEASSHHETSSLQLARTLQGATRITRTLARGEPIAPTRSTE